MASGLAMAQAAAKPVPSAPAQQVADQAAKDAQKPATAAQPAVLTGGTKVAPEPKTKEEEAAMKAVIAKMSDPAAMTAAADDFSAKYPNSNVRGMLYRQIMLVYEQQGADDKAYEAGRKAMTFDPDDPLTLVHCSMYLSSHTHDSDLDKDERLRDAKKMANDGLANIDQLRLNAQSPEAEKQKIKDAVRSEAYEALAIAAQATKDWPTAEANYAKSMELSPDPATVLRLGFSQQMQNKLDAALASYTQAIDLGTKLQADQVVRIATAQKESVEKVLAKRKAAMPTAPATTPATPAAPQTPKQ